MAPATGPSQAASPSESSPAGSSPDVAIAYKRRISELEQEIENIRNAHKQSKAERSSLLIAGRCIRRLVSLTDRVEDLVSEADRRACQDDPDAEYTQESERVYSAYQQLMYWKPSLVKLFSSNGNILSLKDAFKELNRGADSARGDGAASLKPIVIQWLMETYPYAASGFQPGTKFGRGFKHDVTGRLLCPVDYNWQDETHRAFILDSHPDFLVTSNSWPAFLYEGEKYDPKDPSRGLFKNRLLLKAFKHIFTSPSSALEMDIDPEDTVQLKKQRKLEECSTRSHVAALLGMKSVSPRAIAYITVQLRFALSSCGSWRIMDGDFNYLDFYNNIVSFFESAEMSEDKKFIEDLLFWWNRKVFKRENMSVYRPRNVGKMSVAMSLRRQGGVDAPATTV